MRIDVAVIDGWLQCIALEGELDAYTAPQFMESVTATLDTGCSWLVVDLRRVEYIDSVGLGILIGGAKRAGEKNGDMAVACNRPNVKRVFEVSGTAELLNVVDGLDEAKDMLASERADRSSGCSSGSEGEDA